MPLVLAILDGFGVAPPSFGNAIWRARTPSFDALTREGFTATLQASGLAVGLPWGEPGNSEVGHLTAGSGRVIYHHLPRIVLAIRDGSFFKNPVLKEIASHLRNSGGKLHLLGLTSSGGVHAYIDHLWALFEWARQRGIVVALHAFTDGRDATPHEGKDFLPRVIARMHDLGVGRLASFVGRYYAMDRDGNWERTKAAWNLFVHGEGERIRQSEIDEYLSRQYAKGLSDEFIPPASVVDEEGQAITIQDKDAVLLFDFREDSERQLARTFAHEKFDSFDRGTYPRVFFATITQYEEGLTPHILFPPQDVIDTLGEVVSGAGLQQLRIAETEKYAHVTYFFNGGKEVAFPGEERRIIPSLEVAHVDAQPQMRAREVADEIIVALAEKRFDFIVANFANADMVGHTGNFTACVEAVEVLDNVIGQLLPRAQADEMTLIVTGDHGNVEAKIDPHTGRPLTEHTTNPVPLYITGFSLPDRFRGISKLTQDPIGTLADIAPTILGILKLQVPVSMTGRSLLR